MCSCCSVMYMQSNLICSALYSKCPYDSVLYMKSAGKAFLVEDCHAGDCTTDDNSGCATRDWCPFNMARHAHTCLSFAAWRQNRGTRPSA